MEKYKWEFKVEEESQSAYRHTGKRYTGNIVDFTETTTNHVRLLREAIEIEENICGGLGEAIFEVLASRYEMCASRYHKNYFGSWVIESKTNRINYDGKDSQMNFEIENRGWHIKRSFRHNELEKMDKLEDILIELEIFMEIPLSGREN